MKYIVIIPARIGSKRFPNKNIYPLNGKPLISHTIEYALETFPKSDIWVNTDSKLISEVVDSYGINVFFRPDSLGSDSTSTVEVLRNQIQYLEIQNYIFDAVILLQPTNPLRPKELLKEAIEKFEKSSRSSLVTFSHLEKKYGAIKNNFFYCLISISI